MEHKRYITREGGATVTVFVPYDCTNNCPFCINTQEYKDKSGFSVEKICKSIRKLHRVTPKFDFVFTGGEPLSNLDGLQVMMDCIPKGHRVFINTTMPVSEHFPEEAIIEFTKKNQKKITCINVSRHMVHYVEESNDELLSRLYVPVRVNCVLFKGYEHKNIKQFADRFGKFGHLVHDGFHLHEGIAPLVEGLITTQTLLKHYGVEVDVEASRLKTTQRWIEERHTPQPHGEPEEASDEDYRLARRSARWALEAPWQITAEER